MKLTFDANDANGQPRRFVGMHRPAWPPEPPRDPPPGVDVAMRGPFGFDCSCGYVLVYTPGRFGGRWDRIADVREHWQLGHFDRAVYEVSP